ncbi:MAG: FKBP-type peptidyl-prolyl cis-trans isomerase [Spirochaetales bacterium]|nr:FKBP-type peptidyl-prolyl cis-trans isomerase [Spirochaetales bacterium]
MIIEKNKAVTVEYSLKDDKGVVIDSSEISGEFTYVHGMEQTLEGMEDILEGKEAGFTYEGVIPAAKAYGNRSDEFLIPVPKEEFEDTDSFEVGSFLSIENNYGEIQEMEIVSVDDENVTIDANSPYADMDISFSCKVIEVRDATEEELAEAMEDHEHDCNCGCEDHE